MMKTTAAAMLAAAMMVACGDSPTSPSTAGGSGSGGSTAYQYRATGTGSAKQALITYVSSGDVTSQEGRATLPWYFERTAKKGDQLMVMVVNAYGSGCIKAEILRNGQPFEHAESCGTGITATAQRTAE